MEESISNCIDNSNCVLILTDWEVYNNINWDEFAVCDENTWIFDTRLIFKKDTFENSKFQYWKLGS